MSPPPSRRRRRRRRSRRSRSLPGRSSRTRLARRRSPTPPQPGTHPPGRAATEQTATASRGIALRLLPPSSETSRNGTAAYASRSTRPSTLIAFACPSAIWTPEWPPSPPPATTDSATASGGARVARCVDPDPRVGAARAPDRQDAVLLAVEVDQRRAGEQRSVEGVGALQPDLLGNRHQQLERAVGNRLVLDQRHHRGDCDAVVGAERRPLGLQPVAVADERDPPLGRIVRARRVALAHHVQMALEHHDGRRLASRRPGHTDDEVATGVLLELEPLPVAHSRTCSITGSSWREGRAIRVSASKCAQNELGSSPASTDSWVATLSLLAAEPQTSDCSVRPRGGRLPASLSSRASCCNLIPRHAREAKATTSQVCVDRLRLPRALQYASPGRKLVRRRLLQDTSVPGAAHA